jgi:hypothetical protein
MKKCEKCKVYFHFDDRIRCLYCDGLLSPLSEEEEKEFSVKIGGGSPETLVADIVKDRNVVIGEESALNIVESYFKRRSLLFMYKFSRNEMKMGRRFKRFWVQPLNFSVLIMFIPWIFIDLIDSLIFPIMYQGFCKKCQCKYKIISEGQTEHDKEECEYNQEFQRILTDILTGEIARSEVELSSTAGEKVKQGQRSAYFELCSRKSTLQWIADIFSILISLGIIIGIIIWFGWPYAQAVMNQLEYKKMLLY